MLFSVSGKCKCGNCVSIQIHSQILYNLIYTYMIKYVSYVKSSRQVMLLLYDLFCTNMISDVISSLAQPCNLITNMISANIVVQSIVGLGLLRFKHKPTSLEWIYSVTIYDRLTAEINCLFR